MSTTALVSVEEYLGTTYRPDCDYVDGVLEERNLGQKSHAKLQRQVLAWFENRRALLGLTAFPELRIKVGPRRYRIPDVCIVPLPEPEEEVFTVAPYICIEVLSPEDSFRKMQDHFDDYFRMGVLNMWVLDPLSQCGWWVTPQGRFEAVDGVLRTLDSKVALRIEELFTA